MILNTDESISQDICSFTKSEYNTANCILFGKSRNIAELDAICNDLNIKNNFEFKYCNGIQNASSLIYEGKRYIVYDADYFFNEIGANRFFGIFVLAHEIAHHLNGHTISKSNYSYIEQQEKELQCDFFAGTVLYKFGLNLIELKNILRWIPDSDNEYSTHPGLKKRIEAVVDGYFKEKSITDSKYEQIKKEFYSDFSKYFENQNNIKIKNEANDQIEKYFKTKNKKHLEIAENLLSSFDKDDESIIFDRINIYQNLNKFEELLPIIKKQYYSSTNEYISNIYLNTYTLALDKTNTIDDQLFEKLIKEFPKKDTNSAYINHFVGQYLNNIGYSDKSHECFKYAYNTIKNQENQDLLKSDIEIAYAKSIFNQENLKSTPNYSFCKLLFLKALDIIKNNKEDYEFKKYLPVAFFHLAKISESDNNYHDALDYYNLIIVVDDKRRLDLISKSHFGVYQIYEKNNENLKALNSITKCIETSSTESLGINYYLRSQLYNKLGDNELATSDIYKSCENGFQKICDRLKEIESKK